MSNAAAVMAIVMFVFFLAGVGVGIIVVIALSARRADKADRWNRRARTPRGESAYLAEAEADDDEPNEPPWWQARGD